MGYMMAMGICFACKQIFSFNPVRVPSHAGEPVCAACMERVNTKRKTMGLPPHAILRGAYEAEEVG